MLNPRGCARQRAARYYSIVGHYQYAFSQDPVYRQKVVELSHRQGLPFICILSISTAVSEMGPLAFLDACSARFLSSAALM